MLSLWLLFIGPGITTETRKFKRRSSVRGEALERGTGGHRCYGWGKGKWVESLKSKEDGNTRRGEMMDK